MAKDSTAKTAKPEKKTRRVAKRQEPTVRRQDLLKVTISCLARLGPRGTTGREICRQAGVSHGLLRHYFKNPQNLLFETYEEMCDQFLTHLKQVLDKPEPDPWNSLDRFFAALFSDEFASPDLLGAWLAFWSLVRNNEEFARKNEEFNVEFRGLLASAMDRLPRTAGATPIHKAVPIIAAVMDGLWLDYCLSPSRLSRKRAIELCSVTVRQLVPKPSESAAID